MKIGIDASRANKIQKTGTEWYSYHLIRNFALLDSKNEYILYTNKPLRNDLADLTVDYYTQKKEDRKKEEPKFEHGYQIIKSPHNNFKAKVVPWPFPFFWTLGGLSLRMIVRKPDVLFVPAHTLPFFAPKKTITTIHDVAFMRDKSLYQKEVVSFEGVILRKLINIFIRIITLGSCSFDSMDYLNWSTKFSLKRAKRIIAVSNFTKSEIVSIYKHDPDHIRTIYNGFSSSIYRKIDDKEKIEDVLRGYGIDGPYFLYIGRIEKKKNIHELVKALSIIRESHPDIKEKLVLIGNAGFGFDEVKYTIEQFGLQSDVIMSGWAEEEDLPYLYNGATAFVLPSKHEGFGIPVLQSMACETPLAVSNIPVLREIVKDAGIFFDFNALSIVNALEKLATNKELREKLVRNGIERSKYFNWKKCAEETLNEINNL